jgi:hypothetical protein
MISPRDVSVIVQGPYHSDFTPECLASVARVLPGAQVVLSAWKGDPTPPPGEIQADVVLLNDDPGGVDLKDVLSPSLEYRTAIHYSNVNRQIASTRNGMALANRPYALKLRTDMALNSAGFLDLHSQYKDAPGPMRVFNNRIVTTNARSPRRSFAFFVQDFCSFGETDDMKIFWGCPLIPSRGDLLAMPQAERDARVLVPEQHFLLSAARRRHDIPLSDALDNSPALAELSEKFIAGNFVCADIRRFGARTLKPSLSWVNEAGNIRYTWLWILKASYAEFLTWCRRECDHDFGEIIRGVQEEFDSETADVSFKNLLITEGGRLNPEGLLWLGERSHREGRRDEALNAYVTLLRAGYAHHRLYYHLGVLQIQLGEGPLGVKSLLQAVETAPDFIPAYTALADYHAMAGRPEEAAEWRRRRDEKAAR